jgi:hypothetical protein
MHYLVKNIKRKQKSKMKMRNKKEYEKLGDIKYEKEKNRWK